MFAVPELRTVQVLPPLVVATIVPNLPAATQLLAVEQLTLLSWSVVPDVCVVQVLPPVVVARIVPDSPTAKQVLAVGQLSP
jgi:hypothetical protein